MTSASLKIEWRYATHLKKFISLEKLRISPIFGLTKLTIEKHAMQLNFRNPFPYKNLKLWLFLS